MTLWCGYVTECQDGLVYFAGDTAFGHHFTQIRARFGSPRLALLPIGAYEPRWFMSPVHMAPDEAVRAHDILDAGTSIGLYEMFELRSCPWPLSVHVWTAPQMQEFR